jgi:predicted small secreted protein
MMKARAILATTVAALLGACNDSYTREIVLFVAPQLTACQTISGKPQLADPATTSKRCLQVSESATGPFNPSEDISGFTFEPGNKYTLSVRENLIAPSGSVDYVLLSVLEKTPVN